MYISNLSNLSLAALIYQAILPTTMVIADSCQVSRSEVQVALPIISRIMAYRLLVLASINQDMIGLPTLIDRFEPITQPAFATVDWRQGVTFAVANVIEPYTAMAKPLLFADEFAYQQSLGVLLARTQLSPKKIDKILAWVSLLSLKIIMDVVEKLSLPATKKWLTWQPSLLMQANDQTTSHELSWVTGYHDTLSQQSRLKQQHELYRYPSQDQQYIAQQLTDYLASRPFAIAPASTGKAINALRQPSPTSQPILTSHDIFASPAPTPKSHWMDVLQKYWIATTVVTSAVVFGVIGLIVHDSKPSPFDKTTSHSQSSLASTPKYHDVAIVKVASETTASQSVASQPASTSRIVQQPTITKPTLTTEVKDKKTKAPTDIKKSTDKKAVSDKSTSTKTQKPTHNAQSDTPTTTKATNTTVKKTKEIKNENLNATTAPTSTIKQSERKKTTNKSIDKSTDKKSADTAHKSDTKKSSDKTVSRTQNKTSNDRN